MVRSFQNDLQFGLSNENNVIQQLSSYFKEEIEKTKPRYCPYDAISKTTKYEIKTRRCCYQQYPTTIIPVSKVRNITDKLIFVFHFTDGLYYIVYDKELFDTFEKQNIQIYRKGIQDKPTEHYYIPISQLQKIGG